MALTEVTFPNNCRADIVDIRQTIQNIHIHIYEIKASRSDFLSDLKSLKHMKYLKHCNRLSFAVNEGVAEYHDIPNLFGLVIRNKNGWKTVKVAKKLQDEISFETLKTLLFHRIQHQKNLIRKAEQFAMMEIHHRRTSISESEKRMKDFYNTYHFQIERLKELGIL